MPFGRTQWSSRLLRRPLCCHLLRLPRVLLDHKQLQFLPSVLHEKNKVLEVKGATIGEELFLLSINVLLLGAGLTTEDFTRSPAQLKLC